MAKELMIYSTDCNYIVKVTGTPEHFECYTKDQVIECIRQPKGSLVYKVMPNGELKLLARIKPEV